LFLNYRRLQKSNSSLQPPLRKKLLKQQQSLFGRKFGNLIGDLGYYFLTRRTCPWYAAPKFLKWNCMHP
jgi:hypothetical protein